jgi:hypothetical protein
VSAYEAVLFLAKFAAVALACFWMAEHFTNWRRKP